LKDREITLQLFLVISLKEIFVIEAKIFYASPYHTGLALLFHLIF